MYMHLVLQFLGIASCNAQLICILFYLCILGFINYAYSFIVVEQDKPDYLVLTRYKPSKMEECEYIWHTDIYLLLIVQQQIFYQYSGRTQVQQNREMRKPKKRHLLTTGQGGRGA